MEVGGGGEQEQKGAGSPEHRWRPARSRALCDDRCAAPWCEQKVRRWRRAVGPIPGKPWTICLFFASARQGVFARTSHEELRFVHLEAKELRFETIEDGVKEQSRRAPLGVLFRSRRIFKPDEGEVGVVVFLGLPFRYRAEDEFVKHGEANLF